MMKKYGQISTQNTPTCSCRWLSDQAAHQTHSRQGSAKLGVTATESAEHRTNTS
jgi:hypothetical protein